MIFDVQMPNEICHQIVHLPLKLSLQHLARISNETAN